MDSSEIVQSLIFTGFSFLAPIVTFGGGILVSNALTLTGIDLVTAAAITVCYFFINGTIGTILFRKHIVWNEVKNIFPLATVGSILGGFFLSKISPTLLLLCMLYFALRFLYQSITKRADTQEESKVATWLLALLSGFLASAALPGGGLRNSYMLSKGYALREVHGTTQVIGLIGWFANIVILFKTNILTSNLLYGLLLSLPLLIIANILTQKGLLHLPQGVSKKISFIAILAFSMYALVKLIESL